MEPLIGLLTVHLLYYYSFLFISSDSTPTEDWKGFDFSCTDDIDLQLHQHTIIQQPYRLLWSSFFFISPY
jgi:hypothetical protein